MIDYHRLKNTLLAQLNWVRQTPAEVAQAVVGTRVPLYRGVYIHLPYGRVIKTMEGVSAVEELIEQLKLSTSVDALQWSPGLGRAAEVHAHQMGALGLVSHKDPRNRDLPQRLLPYCQVKGKALELIELSGVQSQEILFQLLTDDGLVSRSRRKALINPIFKHVGIGIARHKTYGHITVLILAQNVTQIQYQFVSPPVQLAPQVIVAPSPQYVETEQIIAPDRPIVIKNIGRNSHYSHNSMVLPGGPFIQSEVIQQLPDQHQMRISIPQLQMIPEVPESKITIPGSNIYAQPPLQIHHQSLPVINDVTRNRILYAKTYDKNIFGGQNDEQCLLF